MLIYTAILLYFFSFIVGSDSNSTKRKVDDYYLNYDYEITNNTINLELKPDSYVLPITDSKYTVDVLPNVELPDDSLADMDLREHDTSNIMYVYYGSHNKNVASYGSEAIIIGSVLSCAAQILTIFCVLLKKNLNGRKEMKKLFLHLMCCFCFSNLFFMLGVYATKVHIKCLIISLLLHYLHLLNSLWLFLYCYYIFKRFSSTGGVQVKYFTLIAYVSPIALTLVTYLITPQSYESTRFCFISVQKGIILNYMFPVSMLIILTTVYSLNGLRKINMELSKLAFNSSAESLSVLRNEFDNLADTKQENVDSEVTSLRESKTCLKLLCVTQSAYAIVWFIVILALENLNNNSSLSIIYAITTCILNWYILFKTKAFLPSINTMSDIMDTIINSEPNSTPEPTNVSFSRRGSSDSIPLLNSETCTELRELQKENISTISS